MIRRAHRHRVRRSGVTLVAAALVFGTLVVDAAGADAPAADVVVVGDSLTADPQETIAAHLEQSGLTSVHIDALGARRISTSYEFQGWRNAGLDAIHAIHAQGIDPVLWVVELGTNDLPMISTCGCSHPEAMAGDLIDAVLAAIGNGEPVAWVTVLNRDDPIGTAAFNEALWRRAGVDPLLTLIDWHATAVGHPEWFADHVHQNDAGVLVFAEMYAVAIRRLLAEPLTAPDPLPPGAERTGFGSYLQAAPASSSSAPSMQ